MNDNTHYSSGLGILDVVQIVLIILKICGVITAPWYMVLIPLWISLTLIVIYLIIILIITKE